MFDCICGWRESSPAHAAPRCANISSPNYSITMALACLGSTALCGVEAAACCTCSAIAGCCCRAARGDSRKPSPATAKVAYFLLVVITAIVALTLYEYGDEWHGLRKISALVAGCGKGSTNMCFGAQAVYRMSFALACFFAVMTLGSMSEEIHCGYWLPKLVLLIGLTTGAFYMPAGAWKVPETAKGVMSREEGVGSLAALILFLYWQTCSKCTRPLPALSRCCSCWR